MAQGRQIREIIFFRKPPFLHTKSKNPRLHLGFYYLFAKGPPMAMIMTMSPFRVGKSPWRGHLWMVCCLEWPPSPVDDCHMTSSVDAFEFKSVASTSSRYVFESRHQRAHHNISDELEPSLTTLTFVLRDLARLTRWSATERWKTYSKSTGVTGGTFGRTQDESFGLGGWCRQSHDRVTSKRFEQAIDDHPISWKTKQEHRETKRGTLDCHILSWRWIMVTEALRSEVRTKIYRLSRDHLKRRRCV